MQSLPTALNNDQLHDILAALQKLPTAKINHHGTVITVTATKKATGETVKVLSAASANGTDWHVMTVPGLLSVQMTATA